LAEHSELNTLSMSSVDSINPDLAPHGPGFERSYDLAPHAPGTERLYDLSSGNDEEANFLHSLQHVQKGDSHVLLVPQPSITNPNDPLRWSSMKKTLTFANGLAYSFLGAVTGPIMAAGM
jgi:hypothetical protein